MKGCPMARYGCPLCSYVYDESEGDPDEGFSPGTSFEDIPNGWLCPVCQAKKKAFRKVD